MRNGFLLLLVACCAALAILAAQSALWFELEKKVTFKERLPNGAILLGHFESYLTKSETLALLDDMALGYEIKSAPTTEELEMRRPFEFDTIFVTQFTHLNSEGSLELTFFNDRLFRIRYFAQDFGEYHMRVSHEYQVKLTEGTEAHISEFVRLWMSVDHRGLSYVGWEDIRLASEIDLWIKRYSCPTLRSHHSIVGIATPAACRRPS